MALEEGWSNKTVHDLEGGIMGWEGAKLPDYPRVEAFDKSKSLSGLLYTAMDLEKGAFRFYVYVTERFGSEPFSKTFEKLSKAETAHAKAVYRYWKKGTDDPPDFDRLYRDLKGEILEGGERLGDVVQRVEAMKGNVCLHLVELALHIENSAFDLYRTMAERTESTEARNVFLDIAQAEKTHMKSLINAVDQCGQ
jgi:rubrerythrin